MLDPKLIKRIQAYVMDFDFKNLSDNDWFMIEEILSESLPYHDYAEPEDNFTGMDMFL